MTVYLVSSFHRSGSSMMMRCLEAGGMHAVYGHEQDFLNVLWGRPGYQPNPGGFYALDDPQEFNRPDFAVEYEGTLVKVPANMLYQLASGDYQVILMRRDPAEMRASMAEFTPYDVFGLEATTYFYDLIFPAFVARLMARGLRVDVVDYATVIEAPRKMFEALKEAGWPIDPEKSAACVDVKQRRQVIQ